MLKTTTISTTTIPIRNLFSGIPKKKNDVPVKQSKSKVLKDGVKGPKRRIQKLKRSSYKRKSGSKIVMDTEITTDLVLQKPQVSSSILIILILKLTSFFLLCRRNNKQVLQNREMLIAALVSKLIHQRILKKSQEKS